MALSPIDYTEQLAKQREIFREKIDDNKASYDESVANIRKTAQGSVDKAKDNFLKEKEGLEKDAQERVELSNTRTTDAIREKKEEFRNRLKGEQQDFRERSHTMQAGFNKRLNDIKTAYDDSMSSQKVVSEERSESMDKYYDKRVADINTDKEQYIKEVSDNALRSNKEYRDRIIDEKRRLASDFVKKTNQMGERQTKELMAQNYEANEKLNTLRDSYQKSGKEMLRNYNNTIQNQKDSHEEAVRRQAAVSQERSDAFRQTMSQKSQEEAIEHGKQRAQMARDFADEKVKIKNQFSSLSGDDVNENLLREQEKDARYGRNIKRLNEHLDHLKEDFAGKTEDQRYEHKKDIDAKRIANTQLMEELERDNHTYVSNSLADSRRKMAEMQETYDQRDTNTNKDFGIQSARDQEKFKRMYRAQETRYNKLFGDQEKDKGVTIEGLKRNLLDEKAQFAKRTLEESNRNYQALRKEFGNKFKNEMESNRKVQHGLELESEKVAIELNGKLASERRAADNKLVNQQKLFSAQREEDYRSMKELMRQREMELQKLIDDINFKNSKDAQATIFKHEKEMRGTRDEYEGKLRMMTADYERKFKIEKNNNTRDIMNLKTQWEAEKHRLVSQYENQIETLRNSFDAQVAKLTVERA